MRRLSTIPRSPTLALLLPCLLSFLSHPATAQAPADEEAAVLAAAQALLDVINGRDAAAAADLLLPEGALVRVVATPGGGRPEVIPHHTFIRTIGGPGPVLHERMWDPEVSLDGLIATVRAPYDFHVDGTFSHCGVNVFSLVRSGSAWKVAGVVYTVQRDICPASPLGPPGS
jgi:hypothetical protein